MREKAGPEGDSEAVEVGLGGDVRQLLNVDFQADQIDGMTATRSGIRSSKMKVILAKEACSGFSSGDKMGGHTTIARWRDILYSNFHGTETPSPGTPGGLGTACCKDQ